MSFKFNVMVFLYRAEKGYQEGDAQVDGDPVDDGDNHEFFAAEFGDDG